MNWFTSGAGTRYATLIFALSFVAAIPAERLRAQILPAAAGTVGGFVAGTIVTTGTVVLEARLGHYIYGLDDLVSLRPELLPMALGPVVGGVLGAKSPATLGRAGTGALVGLAGGAAIGAGVGTIIGSTSEAQWAGGIIGGAAGMLAGAIINGSRRPNKDDGSAVPLVALSIRLPGGRR